MLARTAPVFVDTSAWYAVADAGDSQHAVATRQFARLSVHRTQLVTTNYVVSETYTLLRVRLGHTAATEFLRRLRASPRARRVFVEEAWEAEAERLLDRYADQDFSYVDATSFVTMRRLGIEEAFAGDHHFEVAGFRLATS
ncbi:MAG: PIN domain-containing protein [Chloroflexi bacterium]|nr:PIN domain-containing protein [Chloroflexota bacterium]